MITAATTATYGRGIVHVSYDEYAAWPDWNPSAIRALTEKSPLHLRYRREHPDSDGSDAMTLGKAEHVAVFEPDDFPRRYVIWDGGVRRGKAWDAFCAANSGREILTEKEYARCAGMRRAVVDHPSANLLLARGGKAEISIRWIDPGTGLPCKGRPDWISGESLTDLKTARDHTPRAFANQASRLGYCIALAAYQEGLACNGIVIHSVHFIAVESSAPFDVIRYDVSEAALKRGRQLWHAGLQRIKFCLERNEWPGYAPEPYPFDLPAWDAPEESLITIGGASAFAANDESEA